MSSKRKFAQKNFTSFDSNLKGAVRRGKSNSQKPAKTWILRGLKLRGLTRNQMNTSYSMYEIDQRKKLNTLSDFENQKPTPIGAAHAFSKIERNFQKSISQGIGSKF